MTVKKILLTIYYLFFLVIEVLWAPVSSFIYWLMKNTNHASQISILPTPENINVILTLLALEIISMVVSLIFVHKTDFRKSAKYLFTSISIILIIITGFVFYTAFYMRNGIGF